MGQDDLVPFSKFIAGILLFRRSYTAIEIVNILSMLGSYGIFIDDENDELDYISCCVERDLNYNFYLKNDLCYDTVLSFGVDVASFLRLHTNERLLSILNDNMDYFIPRSESISDDVNKRILSNSTNYIKKKLLSKQKKFLEYFNSKGRSAFGSNGSFSG